MSYRLCLTNLSARPAYHVRVQGSSPGIYVNDANVSVAEVIYILSVSSKSIIVQSYGAEGKRFLLKSGLENGISAQQMNMV